MPASTRVLFSSPGLTGLRRPKVSGDSSTVGLSAAELVRLLEVAEAHSPRSGALVTLLAYNGLRIDEALSADTGDYTYQRGHRVLRITRKGRKRSTEPLAPRRSGLSTPTWATPTPRQARCSWTAPRPASCPTSPPTS